MTYCTPRDVLDKTTFGFVYFSRSGSSFSTWDLLIRCVYFLWLTLHRSPPQKLAHYAALCPLPYLEQIYVPELGLLWIFSFEMLQTGDVYCVTNKVNWVSLYVSVWVTFSVFGSRYERISLKVIGITGDVCSGKETNREETSTVFMIWY